jgi:hypothetical protein
MEFKEKIDEHEIFARRKIGKIKL